MAEAPRNLYPLFLDLRERCCLVVGAGNVARRKILSLLECGARVVVVAPEASDFGSHVEVRRREFRDSDLEGMFFAVAATNNAETNHRIAQLARERGCVVNDVDSASFSDALVPAIFRRGEHVVVAVSTSGASPLLAQHLRDLLERVVSEAHGKAAEILASRRDHWKPTEEELRSLIQSLSIGE
jgi:precorrin-2 dehydrogenase/sirohydrochlorin ferrochelatase